MGLKLGKHSFVSPKASIYGDVEVGDNCRIDDFCILTGNIKLGNHIHIACFSFLSGSNGIILEDFSGFAPRTTMLTASDDYKGFSLVSPQVSDKFKPFLERGKILVKRHALIGINSVIMPGVTVGEGASVGAYTFINKDLAEWGMYAGVPAKKIGERNKKMLDLEKEFLSEWN